MARKAKLEVGRSRAILSWSFLLTNFIHVRSDWSMEYSIIDHGFAFAMLI